ncbi:hypothetical protein VDGE_30561 [Verticillium dahliae]|uniref:Uncharacterized protein n=1 Tax=Verticillium dahliae TaxID=27337 RepID=A0A444RPR6_VERDA|nr:hypothetical protein VDGE_30561 [Verticillium dahliae]
MKPRLWKSIGLRHGPSWWYDFSVNTHCFPVLSPGPASSCISYQDSVSVAHAPHELTTIGVLLEGHGDQAAIALLPAAPGRHCSYKSSSQTWRSSAATCARSLSNEHPPPFAAVTVVVLHRKSSSLITCGSISAVRTTLPPCGTPMHVHFVMKTYHPCGLKLMARGLVHQRHCFACRGPACQLMTPQYGSNL